MYSMPCTPEITYLNWDCVAIQLNSVKSRLSLSEDIWEVEISLSLFNFLIWYELQYMHYVVVIACQPPSSGCLPMIAHVDMIPIFSPFFFFPLAPYFTLYNSDPVWI